MPEAGAGPFAGSTVVVTGGGSGLGAAIADRFASAGSSLALLDIDGQAAEEMAVQLRTGGTDSIARRVDVADRTSLNAAVADVGERFGRCDVLCANVGVQQFGAIESLSAQDWEWVLSVNVRGTIDTVAAFLPLLRKGSGERHVVLTASASVFQPAVRMGAYVASKYAVVGYGEVLRRELAEEGIHVALLFPAGMATRHLQSSVAARPAQLGPSRLERADIDAMLADAKIVKASHVASAEHAVRNLLADLQTREPYIFTHGEYRQNMKALCEGWLAGFDRMAG